MRESSLRYLLAVALVLVAGYGAYVGVSEYAAEPPDAAPTTTPTGTPEGTTTDEQLDQELAPGLIEGGVDAWNLSHAHARRLQNTSFTIATSRVAWTNNRSSVNRVVTYSYVGSDGYPTYFVHNASGDFPDSRLAGSIGIWTDGDESYERYVDQNETITYRHTSASRDRLHSQLSGKDHIYSLLQSVNVTVVERIEDDGTTLYRVVSTSQPRYEIVSDRPRSNYSLTALIDSTGLVHRYRAIYDLHGKNQTWRVSMTWRLSAVGTTIVERPPWIDEAKNATAERTA